MFHLIHTRAVVCQCVFVLALASAASVGEGAEDADAAQAKKDATIVQALLRLENVDVNASPKVKAAVLRYLDAHKGTERFLELVERFDIREMNDALLEMALEKPTDTLGVNAAKLLLEFGDMERLRVAVNQEDDRVAADALTVLGYTGDERGVDVIGEVIGDQERSKAVRVAAVSALGRSRAGEQRLLEVVKAGQLPADLEFAAANVLHASLDAQVREEAAKHLKMPAAANSQPLPPIAVLAERKGDAKNGKTVFSRTCAVCHQVDGVGIEFGPDLSEIGDKLAHKAMYVAILDPSAGISFGYEGYIIKTRDGGEVLGYITSETDEKLTVRLLGGIVQELNQSQVVSRTPYPMSLMTPGLQRAMTEQELVDLVEYLTTLKKGGRTGPGSAAPEVGVSGSAAE